MAVGAVRMSLSTIVVAANAQLLRRVHLRPDALVPATPTVTGQAPARTAPARS